VGRSRIALAWLTFHFVLIIAICSRQLWWLIANGLTLIPFSGAEVSAQSGKDMSTTAGPRIIRTRLAKEALLGYMHSAGIEGAYGFFAPNVPENFKLAFEFRYPDGHVEYDLPNVSSDAAGLRLGSLLDKIGRSDSEQYRRILIRMLTSAAWENHPDAPSVHTVLGKLRLPDPFEYERGVRPSYQFVAAYDFERSADSNSK
jgi:hypothetical protein